MKLIVEGLDEVYHPVVVFKHKIEVQEVVSQEDVCQPEVIIEQPKMAETIETETIEAETTEPAVIEEQPVLVSAVEKMDNTRRKSHSLSVWGSRLGTLAVAVIVMVAVSLVVMRLTGFRTFTVMSGSMEPELPVGSLIYVRPVDYSTLNVGDVISYVANDEKTVVTHRIVSIEVDKNDSDVWRFKTKGDTNSTADAGLVHYKNVLGTPMFVVPFIGYVAYNIQQPPGIYIALVVGTLLLAWTFLPGTLEERRKIARKSIFS